jgi:hypothetical protein
MEQPSNRRNDWRSRYWVLCRVVLALGPFASVVLTAGIAAAGGHAHKP